MIIYEHPFNERIRTWLRFEHLCRRFRKLVHTGDALAHHFAFVTLFEVLDVCARADLKTDIMRDLERQKTQLTGWRGHPAVDEDRLNHTIAAADQCFFHLQQLTGKLGQSLMDDEWLMSIRSRVSIPGGTCEFDLPAYHAWQHLPLQQRQTQLWQWFAPFQVFADSVDLLLSLLRTMGQEQHMTAIQGSFQQNLPQGKSYQMLRLHMPDRPDLFPEISANRLIIAVRIMQRQEDGSIQQHTETTNFRLSLCA